jgi:hypothetical protein
LATLGLYVLARLTGDILGIIDSGLALPGFHILSSVVQVATLIVPRLDLMAQTSWLIYGPGDVGALFILMQGGVYTTLLVMAALMDLVRRQF